MNHPARRLAAVLFVDIVEYSALSSESEDTALQAVQLFQSESRSILHRFGGRVVKYMGDGLLAEFPSVENAVYSAHALRASLASRSEHEGLGEIRLRSAIHLGELFATGDGDLYGEGVNLAARLQSLGNPGNVIVSGDVWRQLHNRDEFTFESLGVQPLKGIELPVESFLVTLTEGWAPNPLPRVSRDNLSLAVLPFVSLGQDETDTLFAEGMTEDVIAAVSKIHGLRVASRTSVMRYRDTGKGIREIAGELGVASLLEGSVRRSGDRVRIVVQLIDVDGDDHLWSETYDRDLIDVLEIQSEIAENVAAQLRTALTPEERRGIEAGGTTDLSAYQLYTKGRAYLHRLRSQVDLDRTESNIQSAIELFEQSLRRDPQFARAHAGVAHAYNELAGLQNPAEAIQAGLTAARRALSLAPELSEGHSAMGYLESTRLRLRRAVEHLEQAVKINPNDVSSVYELTWCTAQLGELVSALRWAHRAVELEPNEGVHYSALGRILVHLGAFPEAHAWLKAALEIEPDNAWALAYRASLFMIEDRMEEARKTVSIGLNRCPGSGMVLPTAALMALIDGDLQKSRDMYLQYARGVHEDFAPFIELAWIEARLGRRDRSAGYLDRVEARVATALEEDCQGWWRQRFDLVALHAIRGEGQEAIQELEDSINRGWLPFRRTRIEPFFESLSEEPSFHALLDRSEAELDRMREQARSQGLVTMP